MTTLRGTKVEELRRHGREHETRRPPQAQENRMKQTPRVLAAVLLGLTLAACSRNLPTATSGSNPATPDRVASSMRARSSSQGLLSRVARTMRTR